MVEEELRYWLALWRVKGLGIKRLTQILAHYSKLSLFFSDLSQGKKMPFLIDETSVLRCKNPDWQGVEKDLSWFHQSEQHHILTFKDPSYPMMLKEIHGAPPLLFVRGDVSVLSRKQLGIVGSRKPTMVGLETARQFASALAKKDWCITGGLALGIDGAAHRGALQGVGKTVDVLCTGIDQIYPRAHKELYGTCGENGALVSEFPCGIGPQAAHFPRRNRLVSGLSQGVLVVEAALKSGSLITARLALGQGREVFAIPGSIYSEQSQGCLKLIQEGAKCVSNVDDILDEFAFRCIGFEAASCQSTSQPQSQGQSPIQANAKAEEKSFIEASKLVTKAFSDYEPKEDLLATHVMQHARVGAPSDAEAGRSSLDILSLLSDSPVSLDTIIEQANCSTHAAIVGVQSLMLSGKVIHEPQGYVLKPNM